MRSHPCDLSTNTRRGTQNSIRSVLRDSRDDLKVVDLRSSQSTTNIGACLTNIEQKRHPLLAANATELSNIFQVFVKTLQGKSITINSVTGQTSVEDLKFKVKEKTEMPGVWPELKYQSEWLHDGKTLSAYGIDQGATLEMTWLLLGGGPTPAPALNTWAESSHAAAPTMLPSDENDAVDLGPRSRSVSPSITTADDNADEEWASARAACKPKVIFVNQRAVHEPDATDSRTMVESLGPALPRNLGACNVESLEGEGAADALSHSMEALNAAREAPVLDIPAVNGANALDASLASESARVFMISPYLLCTPTAASRTCTHRRQIAHPHFFLGAKVRSTCWERS